MLDQLKGKSGKREYALATFLGLTWLTWYAATHPTPQAVEVLRIALVPGMVIIGWGTGLHWYAKQKGGDA